MSGNSRFFPADVAPIIPAPSSFRLKGGDVYVGDGFRVTSSDTTDRSLFDLHVEEVLGRLALFPEPNALPLMIDVTPSAAPDGWFHLDVEERGITIRTGTTAAVRYALDSLRQLHRHFGDRLPCLEIVDEPRFLWRGMHLDCARLMPVGFVLRFLDLLAMHRMNVFHWHLTDDQGWRLEMPSRPLLIERGSSRGDGARRHQGWYSSNDVKKVVERAAALGITVIPEIDVPGHCTAALVAYPELACFSPPTDIPDPPAATASSAGPEPRHSISFRTYSAPSRICSPPGASTSAATRSATSRGSGAPTAGRPPHEEAFRAGRCRHSLRSSSRTCS